MNKKATGIILSLTMALNILSPLSAFAEEPYENPVPTIEFKVLSKLTEAKATEKLSDSVDSINDMLKSGKSIDEIKAAEKLKILDEVNTLASGEITRIAGKYDNLECVECANEVMKRLDNLKLPYEPKTINIKDIDGINSDYLNIWSDSANTNLSTNGFHKGIEFNGKIYENIYKNGITFEDWLRDMNVFYENGSTNLYELYRTGKLTL